MNVTVYKNICKYVLYLTFVYLCFSIKHVIIFGNSFKEHFIIINFKKTTENIIQRIDYKI